MVITPDFLPATGGIQLLMARVAERIERFAVTVVTRRSGAASPGASPRVRRTPRTPGRSSLLVLNAGAAAEGVVRPPDVILCGHIVCAAASAVIQRCSGAPIVTYLYADELPGHPRLTRFAIRQSDAVIAISRYTWDMALQYGADPARLHLIPPGVDDVEPPVRQRDSGAPTIITVARLDDRYKGHDVVLAALPEVRRAVPGTRWIVVGDGRLRTELQRRAAELGLSDVVRFTGRVSDSERDGLLRSADVFVMPSRLPPGDTGGEGFGIVYLEAAMHGIPSVAGNVGGAVDAVADGETGMLVDPTSPEQIARALTTLLADREHAQRMGRAARARAERFGWDAISARVEDVLAGVLDGPRP